MTKCRLCQTRRARRYCPGIDSDICSLCCGTEREVTVSCPFECEYLQESRRHDKPPELNPDEFPNREIRVTESFLIEHETLLTFLGRTLFQTAVATVGAADSDVRDALASIIRTYRTLDSGLYYETRPDNAIAARIQEGLQNRIREFREETTRRTGLSSVRDADVLGILAFLQRLELQHNNGRRKGRAFLHFLRGFFPDGAPEDRPDAAGPPLIVT